MTPLFCIVTCSSARPHEASVRAVDGFGWPGFAPVDRIIRASVAGFAVVVFFNLKKELYHGNEEKSKESSEKTG